MSAAAQQQSPPISPPLLSNPARVDAALAGIVLPVICFGITLADWPLMAEWLARGVLGRALPAYERHVAAIYPGSWRTTPAGGSIAEIQ